MSLTDEGGRTRTQLLKRRWAYVRSGEYLFSFAKAPDELPLAEVSPHKYAWRHYPSRFGVKSEDLVKILVKRSLFVACYEARFSVVR